MNKSSFFTRSLFVAFIAFSATYLSSCRGNSGDPVGNETSTSIEGVVNFTYRGQTVTAANWPFSDDRTIAFPSGYIRVAVIESDANGRPLGAPAAVFGSGTGIQFSELTNGRYSFKLDQSIIQAGKHYVISPTYVNVRGTRGGPGGDVQILIGSHGNQTIFGFGSAILATNSRVTVEINSDIAIGEFAYNATANAANNIATFMGSVTVSNPDSWPTGNPFAPGLTPAQVQQQEYLALTAYRSPNVPGPGRQPDVFILLSRPARGNMTIFNASRNSFGANYTFGEYNNININVFRGFAPRNPTAAPPAVMTTPTGSVLTLSATNYMMNWQPTLTLAN